MPNGRCRMHGGPSTGPRTAEGKARIRASRTKHGRKSQAAIQQRREARATLRTVRELLLRPKGPEHDGRDVGKCWDGRRRIADAISAA
jgi:hypothetical protein